MLYWGIFTAGFIVGGILTSFVLSKDVEKDKSVVKINKRLIKSETPEEVFFIQISLCL